MSQKTAFKMDYVVQHAGKRIPNTKRVIGWKFAIIEGDKNTANAKIEQHTLILVWSTTSGKRVVYFDGMKMHFSQGMSSHTDFSAL